MIYLFEDRTDRMHYFLNDNISEYYDVLECDSVINIDKENLDNFLNSLPDLDIVILHKSYAFNDKTITPDNVKQIVKKLNKKFVLFSGGLNNAIIDENELVINSGSFYKNLGLFIDKFRKNNETDLVNLIFDNHNQYLKHQCKKFQNKIMPDLIKLKSSSNLKIDIVKTYKTIRNNIDVYLTSSEFSEDKEKLTEYLNKKIENNDLNYTILFEQLEKMLGNYEYN